MAANRNRYADNTLAIQKDGVTYQNLIAIHATDYINEVTIKQLFHLDYVHKVQDGYFIGGILASGSDNLKFHDTCNKNVDDTTNSKGDAAAHQRLSHLRVRASDNKTYALFNDAGLNTKSNCRTSNFTMQDASPMLMWGGSNETRMKVAFSAARFCNTTSRRVEILNEDMSEVLASIELGAQSYSEEANEDEKIIRVSDYSSMNFVAGTTYVLRVVAENSEGSITATYEDSCGIDVGFPLLFDYTTDTSGGYGEIAQEDLTEKGSFYMFNRDVIRLPQLTLIDTDYDPPIMLYTDYFMNRCPADRSNIAPAGWYSDDGQNLYKVNGNGAIVSRGEVSNPQSKGFQIVPYITNNNTIGIEVFTDALTYPLTISTLSFYKDTSSTQSMGNAQTVGYTFTASVTNPINMGTRIDTGLTINIPVDENGNNAGAARFTFAESQYNNGVHNPIYQLISDDFIDKQ